MIGNGFDIHLGLASKYTDFYEWLKTNPKKYQNNNLIEEILLTHQETSDTHFGYSHKWSDFEQDLLEDLVSISNQEHADDKAKERIECLEEMSILLNEYLQESVDALVPTLAFDSELAFKSFENPLKELPSQLLTQTNTLLTNEFKEHSAKKMTAEINFINFNYTPLLELYIKGLKFVSNETLYAINNINNSNIEVSKNILYPNGNLTDTSELGIGTEADVPETLNLTRNEIDFISKEAHALRRKDGRVSAIHRRIVESDILITYGFSLGKSDALYIHTIVSDLINNKNKTAIFVMFDQNYNKRFKTLRYYQEESVVKEKIFDAYYHMQKVDLPEKNDELRNSINDRIIVLFDNGKILDKDTKTYQYFPFEIKDSV